jgi:hypothetical protein
MDDVEQVFLGQRLRAFDDGAGDFDLVEGEAAGRALQRRGRHGDLLGELDANLRFQVGGHGADDLVEQRGFTLRTVVRRLGQKHVRDLAQQLAALLAGCLFREIQKHRKTGRAGRRHAHYLPKCLREIILRRLTKRLLGLGKTSQLGYTKPAKPGLSRKFTAPSAPKRLALFLEPQPFDLIGFKLGSRRR